MQYVATVAVIAALAGGCAHDVRASYPASPEEPTGTLVVLLTQSASGVNVAVNGVLVAEDQRTKRVTVENVPTGTTEVAITANGTDKQVRTWIASEHPTTVPLAVPEGNIGILKTLIGALISVAAYAILR